jgi:hypothetical protein
MSEMPTLPSHLASVLPFPCLAYVGILFGGYPLPTPPWELWPRSVDLTPLARPHPLWCGTFGPDVCGDVSERQNTVQRFEIAPQRLVHLVGKILDRVTV